MLKFSQFGYNTTVAVWLVPATIMAFVQNANTHGAVSKFYAIVAMGLLALAIYHAIMAYQSSGTTASKSDAERRVRSNASQDVAVVDYEKLAAWKWVVCFAVGVLALYQGFAHFQMNSDYEGFASTFMLIYTGVDAVIAYLAFSQFWAIKSGQIVELTHKASDSMFQH
jgi:hypothetical protein